MNLQANISDAVKSGIQIMESITILAIWWSVNFQATIELKEDIMMQNIMIELIDYIHVYYLCSAELICLIYLFCIVSYKYYPIGNFWAKIQKYVGHFLCHKKYIHNNQICIESLIKKCQPKACSSAGVRINFPGALPLFRNITYDICILTLRDIHEILPIDLRVVREPMQVFA